MLSLVAVLALSLSACGGSSDSKTPTTALFLNELNYQGATFTAALEISNVTLYSNTNSWSSESEVNCGTFTAIVKNNGVAIGQFNNIPVDCEMKNLFRFAKDGSDFVLYYKSETP